MEDNVREEMLTENWEAKSVLALDNAISGLGPEPTPVTTTEAQAIEIENIIRIKTTSTFLNLTPRFIWKCF